MKCRLPAGLLGLILFAGVQAGHLNVSLDDIILLSRDGVSDQTLILFLENREAGFHLDAEAIDKLVLAGVSDEVIRYLLSRKTTGSSPRTVVRSYPAVTYVDPYPGYYYTPYYYGSSYAFGFSSYPSYWFGYRSGARHHGVNRHHGGHLEHRGHNETHIGGTHNRHDRRHGDSGELQHVVSTAHRDVSHGNSSQSHPGSAGRGHGGDGPVHDTGGSHSGSSGHSNSSHSSSGSHSRSSGHSSSGSHSGGRVSHSNGHSSRHGSGAHHSGGNHGSGGH